MDALDSESRRTRYSKGLKGNPADSFGTFLGSESKREQSTEQNSSASEYGKDMLKLLFLLARSDAHPISDLLTKSGLGFYNFLRVFEQMRKQNLLDLEGPPGNEIVTLTPEGQQLVQPAP